MHAVYFPISVELRHQACTVLCKSETTKLLTDGVIVQKHTFRILLFHFLYSVMRPKIIVLPSFLVLD